MTSPPERLDVNVLPDSYRRRWLQGRQLLFILTLVILMALAIPLYNLVSSAIEKTAEMNDEVDILNGQLTTWMQDNATKTAMENLVRDYENINQMRTVISDDVEAIENAADQVGMERSFEILSNLERILELLDRNVNPRLAVEVMMLSLPMDLPV